MLVERLGMKMGSMGTREFRVSDNTCFAFFRGDNVLAGEVRSLQVVDYVEQNQPVKALIHLHEVFSWCLDRIEQDYRRGRERREVRRARVSGPSLDGAHRDIYYNGHHIAGTFVSRRLRLSTSRRW